MFPILSVTLFIPLAGALFALAIPREDSKTIRRFGLLVAGVTLILAIVIWANVAAANADESGAVERPSEDYAWISAASFDVHYQLEADGLNAPMVFLTALMILLALFYSTRTVETRVKEYFVLFLMLETSLIGVFLAFDLVLFYAFWVMGLLPMFLIISVWGGEQRERAAIKFFIYNLVGGMVMLIAILGIYSLVDTFNIPAASQARPFSGESAWAKVTFWALFLAFAIRLPCFPFHTWLPDAQAEAPTAGSVVLGGVFLSTGGYGLIRILLALFPEPFGYFTTEVPIIPILATSSIVYGALVCMAQWNLKRLLAYTSMAHTGFVLLGACAAATGVVNSAAFLDAEKAAASSLSGASGAAMQSFAQGIIAGALFFLAGMLHERTGTYDLKAFGGLAGPLPHYYGLMLVAGFAGLGLPGLIGFWGEFFVFKGMVGLIPIIAFAFLCALGLLFTAGYTLWKIVQHLFLGKLEEKKWGKLKDMTAWEKAAVWPLVLLMVLLGFYPTPLLDMFNTALEALLSGLGR